MEWSAYQNEIFKAIEETSDSLIIEAVAGSGKTTTIVEAIRHVPESQSVVFLAFNKSIADELRRRVTQPNASCKTLHALGLTYKAPPHKFYRLEDEDKVCERVIEHLDKRYPWWEFKMVKVGAGKYNFVYVGLREQRPELSEENKNDESLH